MEPESLRQRPELLPRLHFYLRCFEDLGSDRTHDFNGDPMRLSTGQLHTYFQAYGLEDFEEFAAKLRLIDSIYLELVMAKRAKTKTPVGNAAAIPKNPKRR